MSLLAPPSSPGHPSAPQTRLVHKRRSVKGLFIVPPAVLSRFSHPWLLQGSIQEGVKALFSLLPREAPPTSTAGLRLEPADGFITLVCGGKIRPSFLLFYDYYFLFINIAGV